MGKLGRYNDDRYFGRRVQSGRPLSGGTLLGMSSVAKDSTQKQTKPTPESTKKPHHINGGASPFLPHFSLGNSMIISLQQCNTRPAVIEDNVASRPVPTTKPETEKPRTPLTDSAERQTLRGYFSVVRDALKSWPTSLGMKEKAACLGLVRFFRLAAAGNHWLETLIHGRPYPKPSTESLNAFALADELLSTTTFPFYETDLHSFADDLMRCLMRPKSFSPNKLLLFLNSLPRA